MESPANLTYMASQSGTFYVSAAHSYSSIYTDYTGTYTLAVGGGALTDDYAATTATTGRVTVGGSATGVIERSGDADWFAVTLGAGERYGVGVTGTTLSDPWLRVYNSAGVEQASDRYNFDGSAKLAFDVTAGGTFYIAAADRNDYSSSNTGSYTVSVVGDDYRATTATTGRVSVGGSATGTIETNGDADWFAVTLSAGERYGIGLAGTTLSTPWLRVYDSAGVEQVSDRYNSDGNAGLAYTPTTAGTYYISAARSYNSSWSNYTGGYTVSVLGDDYRADTATTGLVSAGQPLTGTIETTGDEDWFTLAHPAGTQYTLSLTGTTLHDPWLRVYDSSGTLLLSDRYNWGTAATLSLAA